MENTSGQNLIDSRDLYNPQTDHLRFRRSTDQKPQCDTNKESSDQESPCPYNMIVTHNSVMWPPYIMEKVCDPTRRPLCTSKCEQNKVAVQPIRRRSRLLGCRNENSSEICYYRKEEEHIKNYCSCI